MREPILNSQRFPNTAPAATMLLDVVYKGLSTSTNPVEPDYYQTTRNERIRAKYADGSTLEDLANEFDLSAARVHQIIHRRGS